VIETSRTITASEEVIHIVASANANRSQRGDRLPIRTEISSRICKVYRETFRQGIKLAQGIIIYHPETILYRPEMVTNLSNEVRARFLRLFVKDLIRRKNLSRLQRNPKSNSGEFDLLKSDEKQYLQSKNNNNNNNRNMPFMTRRVLLFNVSSLVSLFVLD